MHKLSPPRFDDRALFIFETPTLRIVIGRSIVLTVITAVGSGSPLIWAAGKLIRRHFGL